MADFEPYIGGEMSTGQFVSILLSLTAITISTINLILLKKEYKEINKDMDMTLEDVMKERKKNERK